jgi:hypothetical protein
MGRDGRQSRLHYRGGAQPYRHCPAVPDYWWCAMTGRVVGVEATTADGATHRVGARKAWSSPACR